MPVSFGMQQSINYCTLRGITITAMQDEINGIATGETDGTHIRDLIWSALKDGARKAKKSFELEPEDVADMIEDMSHEEMEAFMQALSGTMPQHDMSAEVKKKES